MKNFLKSHGREINPNPIITRELALYYVSVYEGVKVHIIYY